MRMKREMTRWIPDQGSRQLLVWRWIGGVRAADSAWAAESGRKRGEGSRVGQGVLIGWKAHMVVRRVE